MKLKPMISLHLLGESRRGGEELEDLIRTLSVSLPNHSIISVYSLVPSSTRSEIIPSPSYYH